MIFKFFLYNAFLLLSLVGCETTGLDKVTEDADAKHPLTTDISSGFIVPPTLSVEIAPIHTPRELSLSRAAADRAKAAHTQGDLVTAEKEMQVAIAELKAEPLTSDSTSQSQLIKRETLRSYLSIMALYAFETNDYPSAKEALSQLVAVEPGMSKEYAAEAGTRIILQFWYALMKNGEHVEATNLIQNYLSRPQAKEERCYYPFLEYLGGKIELEVFLSKLNDPARKCAHYAEGSAALGKFWVGEKLLLVGQEKEGKLYLTRFLQDATNSDFVEKSIAVSQVGGMPETTSQSTTKRCNCL